MQQGGVGIRNQKNSSQQQVKRHYAHPNVFTATTFISSMDLLRDTGLHPNVFAATTFIFSLDFSFFTSLLL